MWSMNIYTIEIFMHKLCHSVAKQAKCGKRESKDDIKIKGEKNEMTTLSAGTSTDM